MGWLSSIADSALDVTVVPGYTKIGYELRRRLVWERDEPGAPMEGQTALVTGASSGLGLATAVAFARLGASVCLLARDPERGEAAREQAAAEALDAEVWLGVCDLSSIASVRAFAGHFLERERRLEVLVNNAGVLLPERRLSADGSELTFATNVLGPFLLTSLLVPLMRRSAPARVVNVSSGGMYTQRIRVDDLQSERGKFDGPAVYARTKRAQVILTEIWAELLAGSGVAVNAMHPGWADTPGVRSSLPRFFGLTRPLLRSPAQGADTIVWLAASPEAEGLSGRFFCDRRARPTQRLPRTRESAGERRALWDRCVRLSGLSEHELRALEEPRPASEPAG